VLVQLAQIQMAQVVAVLALQEMELLFRVSMVVTGDSAVVVAEVMVQVVQQVQVAQESFTFSTRSKL